MHTLLTILHYSLPAYYKELKKYHLQHHFADFDNGFGVTSRFWDGVFGTELQIPAPKNTKAQ
jgi:4-hydroxysphinganine ceramide fatty acyl 2-hydroxylase